MKAIVNLAFEKVFRAATVFGLAALLVSGPSAFAGNGPGYDSTTGELKAVAYASNNPLKLKVNFENPTREKVTLSIFNEAGQVVYTSNLGHQEIYNGRLDLSSLADGNYTMELQSKSSRFTKPFQIQTQTARLAVVQ